jgi:hypothetical protein
LQQRYELGEVTARFGTFDDASNSHAGVGLKVCPATNQLIDNASIADVAKRFSGRSTYRH